MRLSAPNLTALEVLPMPVDVGDEPPAFSCEVSGHLVLLDWQSGKRDDNRPVCLARNIMLLP